MDITILTAFMEECKKLIETLPNLKNPSRRQIESGFLAYLQHNILGCEDPVSLIKTVFKKRDVETRFTEYHYTLRPTDPINLCYIRLAYYLSRIWKLPFITTLLDVVNINCPNLNLSIPTELEAYTQCIRYNLYIPKVVPRENSEEIAKELINEHLEFSSIQKRRRGGSLDQLSQETYTTIMNQHIIYKPEINSVYVYGKEVFSIRGLLRLNGLDNESYAVRNAISAMPFRTQSSRGERALHVLELYRIRAKDEAVLNQPTRSYSLTVNGVNYNTPYELIRKLEMAHWRKSTALFWHERLFQLIQSYFNTPNAQFTDALCRWCDSLLVLPSGKPLRQHIVEVNALYGQYLGNRNGDPFYLIDWLHELLYDSKHLQHQHLCDLISWYCFNSSVDSNTLKNRQDAVQGLFTTHADMIRDTPHDYFNMPKTQSLHYLSVAEGLSRLECLNKNPYLILIPSLEHDVNLVTKSPLTDTPLSHCILSADNRLLIDLQQSHNYYKKNGQFVNASITPPRLFNAKELERLNTSPYFQALKVSAEQLSDRLGPLQPCTVAILRLFVNSCFEEEDIFSEFIVEDDFQYRQKKLHAYADLLNEIHHKLDSVEKKRLFSHKVPISPSDSNTSWMSLAEYFKVITLDEWNCVKTLSRRLIPLILRYDPSLFLPSIELQPGKIEGSLSLAAYYRARFHPPRIANQTELFFQPAALEKRPSSPNIKAQS